MPQSLRRGVLAGIACWFLAAGAAAADAQRAFWDWFAMNGDRIARARSDGPALVDEITAKLAQVHPGLVFEVVRDPGKPATFVVSADGLSRHVPAVKALVGAAPWIDGWRIVAFRPRVPEDALSPIRHGNVVVAPEDVWFDHYAGDGRFEMLVLHE